MYITEDLKPDLTLHLTVSYEPADYVEEYNRRIKKYAKTITMPGYRPGTVPLNLVRQRYGKAVINEVLSEAGSKALQDYLEEKQYAYFGQFLLINTNVDSLSPNGEQTYNFEYLIGLKDNIHINYELLETLPTYTTHITDADLDDRYTHILIEHAERKVVDSVANPTAYYQIKGRVSTDDTQDDHGHTHHHPAMEMDFLIMPNQPRHKLLQGKKVGDVLPYTLSDYFTSIEEAATIFSWSIEGVEHYFNHAPQLELKEISELVFPVVDEKFCTEKLKLNGVSTPEELKQKLQEDLAEQLPEWVKNHLQQLIDITLIENTQIRIPLEPLRALFAGTLERDKKYSEERLDQLFHQFRISFIKEMIIQAILRDYPELVLTEEDLRIGISERFRQMLRITDADLKEEKRKLKQAVNPDLDLFNVEQDTEKVSEENDDEIVFPDGFTDKDLEYYAPKLAMLDKFVNYTLEDNERKAQESYKLQREKVQNFLINKVTTTPKSLTMAEFLQQRYIDLVRTARTN